MRRQRNRPRAADIIERMHGTRKMPDQDGILRLAEGEYGFNLRSKVWEARPPGMHVGSLENHTVVQHEDLTITVKPSILIDQGDKQWHGFLERGIWLTTDAKAL